MPSPSCAAAIRPSSTWMSELWTSLISPAFDAAALLLRTVEDDPHREIVREIFEPVRRVRGGEQQIAGLARRHPVVDAELAGPRGDDVKLVAVVRGLRVMAFGRVEPDLEVAVAKRLGRTAARRASGSASAAAKVSGGGVCSITRPPAASARAKSSDSTPPSAHWPRPSSAGTPGFSRSSGIAAPIACFDWDDAGPAVERIIRFVVDRAAGADFRRDFVDDHAHQRRRLQLLRRDRPDLTVAAGIEAIDKAR